MVKYKIWGSQGKIFFFSKMAFYKKKLERSPVQYVTFCTLVKKYYSTVSLYVNDNNKNPTTFIFNIKTICLEEEKKLSANKMQISFHLVM